MTLYQHTRGASQANAFNWADGTPSIFAGDTRFCPLGQRAMSSSAIATTAIERKTARTGKSPGTITGISKRPRGKKQGARG